MVGATQICRFSESLQDLLQSRLPDILATQLLPINHERHTFAKARDTIKRCKHTTPIVLNLTFRVLQAIRNGSKNPGFPESSVAAHQLLRPSIRNRPLAYQKRHPKRALSTSDRQETFRQPRKMSARLKSIGKGEQEQTCRRSEFLRFASCTRFVSSVVRNWVVILEPGEGKADGGE
jgi:hypothetical protein